MCCRHRVSYCVCFAGLSELTVAKEREDQRLAELAKQRAREDATLAATEAAAAAAEWEKVYALRLERDQAALRAAEAEAKLRETQDSITTRYVFLTL